MVLQVPNFESPFFSIEDYPEKYQKIVKDLRENGFAVFDFPEEDFERLTKGIREDFNDLYDWDKWRAGGLDSLRIQDAWEFDDRVKRIASNPTVLDILSSLYGRKAFPFQTLNFPVATQQSNHSDHVHFNSVPDRFMCGVWVAFEDVDENNGPLFYYPGSHKWPSYSNADIGVNGEQIGKGYGRYNDFVDLWSKLAEAHGVKKEYFHAKKGQALIWSSNLVHGGTGLKDQNRTRWSQVTHYYFDNCAYYTPVASDVFAGEIFYRDITDVTTGKLVKSKISGRELADSVKNKLRPKFMGQPQSSESESNSIGSELHSKIARFNPKRYLDKNPDVKASGSDPFEHFVRFGYSENREV